MHPERMLGAAILAALLLVRPVQATPETKSAFRLGLIAHDNVLVHRSATAHSATIAVLVEQTEVEVLAHRKSWTQVRIWASIKGWVHDADITNRPLHGSVPTYHAPEVHYHVHAHPPTTLVAPAITTAPTSLSAEPRSPVTASLPTGRRVRVAAWQQDAAGHVWYRIGERWAAGDSVSFLRSISTQKGADRLPAWRTVAGKGMWITLGVAGTSPDALVSAAVHNGITHLYLEAAISPLGFHGRRSVGRIIDAAHKRHVAVIAWVYPYLYDLASDVDLTRQVAHFQSSHGQRFDGIAADLERDVHNWNVRAYSQLVRAYLGSYYLMVGVTYPPQSSPNYPFIEVAHSFDVIAPMDYWHETTSQFGTAYGHMRYGSAYAYRYASDSIRLIHDQVGNARIAPIGQAFDDFGRQEMGPNAPSGSEVSGFMDACKANGAIGASLFQWFTATDAEWRAVAQFKF